MISSYKRGKVIYNNHQREKPTNFSVFLNFENYFNIPKRLWSVLIKFRTAYHCVPVKTGRWYNVLLVDRLCS